MGTEIQKFDITEHIRQKVREVLLASIPDEQMDAMISAEYDLFFKDKYGNDSPFKRLIQEELRKAIRNKVISWMDVNFIRKWDESGTSKLVGDAVAKLTPIVQKSMILDLTQAAIDELRNRLIQGH